MDGEELGQEEEEERLLEKMIAIEAPRRFVFGRNLQRIDGGLEHGYCTMYRQYRY